MEKKTWPGKKILVIEDDEFSFEFIRVSLRDRGLEIMHALDGKTALQVFSENNDLDLIILDIQIPVLDGYEVCKKIREKNPAIPIIAQTAYAMDGEQDRCEKAGCNAYLSKPLNIQKLILLMDRYLS